VQLSTPVETCFLTQVDDLLDAAPDDVDPKALPDARVPGLIWQ
jgi:hypothetical protein